MVESSLELVLEAATELQLWEAEVQTEQQKECEEMRDGGTETEAVETESEISVLFSMSTSTSSDRTLRESERG